MYNTSYVWKNVEYSIVKSYSFSITKETICVGFHMFSTSQKPVHVFQIFEPSIEIFRIVSLVLGIGIAKAIVSLVSLLQ